VQRLLVDVDDSDGGNVYEGADASTLIHDALADGDADRVDLAADSEAVEGEETEETQLRMVVVKLEGSARRLRQQRARAERDLRETEQSQAELKAENEQLAARVRELEALDVSAHKQERLASAAGKAEMDLLGANLRLELEQSKRRVQSLMADKELLEAQVKALEHEVGQRAYEEEGQLGAQQHRTKALELELRTVRADALAQMEKVQAMRLERERDGEERQAFLAELATEKSATEEAREGRRRLGGELERMTAMVKARVGDVVGAEAKHVSEVASLERRVKDLEQELQARAAHDDGLEREAVRSTAAMRQLQASLERAEDEAFDCKQSQRKLEALLLERSNAAEGELNEVGEARRQRDEVEKELEGLRRARDQAEQDLLEIRLKAASTRASTRGAEGAADALALHEKMGGATEQRIEVSARCIFCRMESTH
jgi:chromosome segregation ATPase